MDIVNAFKRQEARKQAFLSQLDGVTVKHGVYVYRGTVFTVDGTVKIDGREYTYAEALTRLKNQ